MAEEEKNPLESQIQNPQSLVAGKAHHRVDLLQTKCFNTFYDGLTIFISIADVTTDIIVLLSYYQQERMEFFWISLVILLLAQLGYVMVFLFTFDIDDFFGQLGDILEYICCDFKPCDKANECCKDCCTRCCLGFVLCCVTFSESKCGKILGVLIAALVFGTIFIIALSIGMIFGHLVAFLMYFAENEDSKTFIFLNTYFGIKKRTRLPLKSKLSDQAKFAIDKINKHGGFMLEAFMEALPQSILQLVAMVYYKETNIISIGSILLSMTSIMTKTFIISQGVEWKSFLFCWLCVITDFFSIFFVVSWIFLSNDYINGDFLGYFSIVGELWCWKIGVSILPPIATVLVGWTVLGFWIVECWIYEENESCSKRFVLMGSLAVFGNIVFFTGFCIFSVVVGLFAEIFCFSIIAVFIFLYLTSQKWDYRTESTSKMIDEMLDFISDAARTNNDRIIRILCINYGYYTATGNDISMAKDSVLLKFIKNQREQDTLHTVTYNDIRENCQQHYNAAIFKRGFRDYKEMFEEEIDKVSDALCDSSSGRTLRRIEKFCESMSLLLFAYVGIPIYGLSRIFTILYPYILVFYIFYYNLLFKLDLFELTMLGVYIFLQWVTIILGFFVFRTHLWLWHILPGKRKYQMKFHIIDTKAVLGETFKYYDEIQWLPFATEIVVQRFGKDIGGIVVIYLKAMNQLRI